MSIDPNNEDIFAGIARLKLPIDKFEFGDEIVLSKTYAHVFGPYMAAFTEPIGKGFSHPGPWKSIGGGIAFDIWYELYLPKNVKLFNEIDNLNTVWIFVALLRLNVFPFVTVPVLSNIKFSEIANSKEQTYFYPIETTQENLFYQVNEKIEINLGGLEWIKRNYKAVGSLYETNEKYAFAFLSIDRAINETRFSMALMTLWGAIEQIFSPDDKQELNYRISLNIASYLEDRGLARQLLFKKIKKLYNARSRAAHGNPTEDKNEFIETYELLKRVIIKMTEENEIPTQAVFEQTILS